LINKKLRAVETLKPISKKSAEITQALGALLESGTQFKRKMTEQFSAFFTELGYFLKNTKIEIYAG